MYWYMFQNVVSSARPLICAVSAYHILASHCAFDRLSGLSPEFASSQATMITRTD